MTRVLVIGGSDAGISAGLRIQELDPNVRPTLVVADAYPNFSICGIPYHVSGEVPDWRALAHRTRADLETAGLGLRLNTRATRIDPFARTVTVVDHDGRHQLPYDELIIGTGAVPIRPRIEGIDTLGPADGVHLLHTMEDTFTLTDTLARQPESAVVVGAGYVGLEMVDALRARGIAVTLVETLPEVLSTVDSELGALVRAELRAHDVDVHTGTTVHRVERHAGRLRVHGSDGFIRTTDVVLVVVGVHPDTALAETAGVKLGVRGAIAVDRWMRATVDHIFAAGDCVQTYHRLLGTDTYLPLGTTAHKQGRVAGENALGAARRFAGSLGTQVVKVFDLAIARTGVRDRDAVGFRPVTHETVADDHKAYYPGSRPIHLRITGDATTGRLLGAQLVGHRDSSVHKRVDVLATAIHHGMTVSDVEDLDLSYTPPLGSPYDAVQVATHAWTQQHGD
ncbi:FAD-dependent oxidoreductase [Amycolatopsis sp. DSM 110486]|uniref:FAD-dependent oxidoreductase n=1 Tax=Amycolatopsis sp. DSM 110486 TaxID=2865832 RepID=UPI001C6996C8|nr:FAD-dependent oxidoreductase [Amycolatopsis sp. DSM 110486]QYN22489.1 FAD-dependent oxidoreductase [Amycolatopsis sp. DSM 110486]